MKALGEERLSIALPQERRALAGEGLPSSWPNNARWHVVLILQSSRPGGAISNENPAKTHGKSPIDYNVNNRIRSCPLGAKPNRIAPVLSSGKS